MISEVDLPVPGGDWLFGQKRSYSNRPNTGLYNGANGYNWFVNQFGYVRASGGASLQVVFDSNLSINFNRVSGSSSSAGSAKVRYAPSYPYLKVALEEDTAAKTVTFVRTGGGSGSATILFNSPIAATAPGRFVSSTDARGVTTTVAAQTGDRIDELQRTYSVSGVTTTESLLYTYYGSGVGAGANKLQYVTFRRKVGAGAWTDIRRAAYDYYGGGDANGNQDDLKSASRQQPNASGGWSDLAVLYYRYYTPGATKGFAHGLKLRVGAEAYRRAFNAGVDLSTASDATLLTYADHYFEYDPSTWAVTKEVSAVCESCAGGGTSTDLFAYAANPRNPAFGFNVWAKKTTQTLPDGSKIIVYTNGSGMPMLNVNVDAAGTKSWCTFSRYDANGRLIWKANPSAVTGYDESYDDLLHFVSATDKYQYLRDSDGLIEVTDYYPATNVGTGAVQYYVWADKVRRGQTGTDVLLRSFTYTSHTDIDGNVVYPVAAEVAYPDDASTATTITTSYAYTWHTNTNRVKQRTTTLPVVSSGQNGPEAAATVVEAYDTYGNLTSRTDERGIVNAYAYDVVLGVVTQQVLNVQVGVTAPGVNVTTDFTYDDLGRLTRTLGPSHTVVLASAATSVRGASWNVDVPSLRPSSGTWGSDQAWTGRGYATGTGPSYTYVLVDPVAITRSDKDGRTTDSITSKRTTGSGALSASDTFVQSDWKSWSSTQYDDQHRTTSARVYDLIPPSGDGSVGTNYGQADYGYDALERLNRVRAAGGTITRTVWTAPQRVASTWVGTDDTGATDSNPAGSGTPNNMVKVSENQYDGGGIGDGNLTQVTQYASAADTRVTGYGYDWRDRRISTDGEVDLYESYTYDNLDRLTQTDKRNTTGSGTLIGRSQTKYDDRGRAYQQITFAVDPSTGTVGNALTANTWYDEAGNVLQQVNAGDGKAFAKTVYNGIGWVTAVYRGYNTSAVSYSQATTVANDTIFAQIESTYDEAGNVLSVVSYDRLNDATGNGALTAGSQPKARVSYAASWYDGIDRQIASANYGAIASFSRPSTVPARSDDVLVTESAYDDAGRAWKTLDPQALENRTAYDAAGRTTRTIESYSATVADDTNRTTNYAYTLDSQLATMTAVNGRTGDQTTTYTYGTTLTESEVARNDLLRYTDYPGSVSGSDRTQNAYNRLGQRRTFTDQRGTVHTFYYDKLGRLTNDCVTTNGTGTDVAVKQIMTAYEVRGMVASVTSTNDATQGSGTTFNQTKMTYNAFAQLTKEEQAHAGAVVGGTPSVQFGYDAGGSNSNEIRINSITYPDGRIVLYDYGTAGGANDRSNRVESIKDGATVLARYTYLGL